MPAICFRRMPSDVVGDRIVIRYERVTPGPEDIEARTKDLLAKGVNPASITANLQRDFGRPHEAESKRMGLPSIEIQIPLELMASILNDVGLDHCSLEECSDLAHGIFIPSTFIVVEAEEPIPPQEEWQRKIYAAVARVQAKRKP
jgi:hypothetical protein